MPSNKNQAMFLYELGAIWLPAMAELDARLRRLPPARIADIGCGQGWSSLGLARAYPKVRVDGFDRDEAAIEKAWAQARREKVTDRITFHVRDVSDGILNGRYDLVAVFHSVHDLDNPVGVLATMWRLAGRNGTIITLADPTDNSLQLHALAAGFGTLEILPIKYHCFQFVRLHR